MDVFYSVQKLVIEVHEINTEGFFLNTPLPLNAQKASKKYTVEAHIEEEL